MRHKIDFFKVVTTGLFIILISCNKSEKKASYENMAIADSTSSESLMPDEESQEIQKDTSRKFIRTAEIKFRVKNVEDATYLIEKITALSGGFVTYTKLLSNIDHHQIDKISADSSLESTYFTVENNIIVRVPNLKLDSTLISISKIVEFLDYRIIKADDIGLQILSNNLTIQRLNNHEKRLRVATKVMKKKLWETGLTEESLLEKKEISDNANISNLSLMDQVNYSTINLTIYQKQEIRRELIANEKNIEFYEPGFSSKFIDSIKSGWKILESIILFTTQLWGLIILLTLVLILYRKTKPLIKK